MAVDPLKYRRLKNGIGHEAALYLADPATTPQKGAAVSAPSAMTAPATMNAAYTQTEVQALRTDVANLRTTVNNLVTALKNAGAIS